MRLTLLGTGCPVAHAERYGPAALLRGEGRAVLFDCGAGVTQRLVAAGCPGRTLDAIFLTHLHSDHLVDLYQIVISSWHQGRDRPQRVFGPPGTRLFVDGTLALWQAELAQRIAHERRPSTAALEVEVTEIADGDVYDLGGVSVRVFAVEHQPVRHAFGFAVEGGGRRLAISGDTRACAAVEEAARGADLLLHEVFIHREMPVVPGVRSAETVANVAAYHTASSEVGKLAARAGVGCLVLTHFVPPGFDRAALLAEVAADYRGPLVIGEDLMTIDIMAGSLEHRGALIGLGRAAGALGG
ncbi:MAG: Rv2407 family type 3 sulfatase [Thalassobaculales bacterium]